jgi:hypothetical protein
MQKLSFLFVGLLVAGLTASVAQDEPFRIDPSTDFSKYKTYGWAHTMKGEHQTYPVDAQITEAVEAELAEKGLRKADPGATDLSICYHSNFGTEKFNRYNDPEFGGHWFTIKTGQVAIDMYESSTKKLVWRNTADINPKTEPKQITKAVSKLLENYPSKKK